MFIVTAAAAVGVIVERWQEDQSRLEDDAEIAAFRLAETWDPSNPKVDLPAGTDEFVVVLDSEGGVIASSRELSDDLLDALVEEVWVLTTSADESIIVDFDSAGVLMTVAGVGCVYVDVCDTVVVGVNEESLGSFLIRHLGWVLGPALLAGVLAMLAARWLVERSLMPVERMRNQLDRITETDLDLRVPVPNSGDGLQLLGESMNATLSRLGAAVSANERFVADAAHELRSPLTGVRAALEVESSTRPSGLIDDSIVELDRASRLVDDLLVLARRQGKPALVEDVDLDDLAWTVVATLRAQHPDLDIATDLEPCRIHGNPDDLQRVITNLLGNAVRYGDGKLVVTTKSAGDTVLLQVDDNGPGVPAADREQIFERFARLDMSRARETGGSGLGLAIAKELVEDHGGSITVSNAAIGGASFRVDLPG